MQSPELIRVLNIIGILSIVAGLIATPFLIFNWIPYLADKKTEEASGGVIKAEFPRKSVAFFLGSCLVGMIAGLTITFSATNETASYLNGLSGHYSVKINDLPVVNPEEVVSELKKVRDTMAHHSHPTTTIMVEVESSSGHLILELRRDSSVPTEYWVFNQAYGQYSNEIGRINTTLFNQY